MRDLIEYVARGLVDYPEDVSVREIRRPGEIILELTVAPEDRGKVIGREGRIAQAMRALLRVPSLREGLRSSLEIR